MSMIPAVELFLQRKEIFIESLWRILLNVEEHKLAILSIYSNNFINLVSLYPKHNKIL